MMVNPCSSARSASRSTSARSITEPSGFEGLLMITAAVRSVMAERTSSARSLKSLSSHGNGHGHPAEAVHLTQIVREAGVGDDDFLTWGDGDVEGEGQRFHGAEGDHHVLRP